MTQPAVVAGRYRVLRPIGRGGMGMVWLCEDELLHREVAVKQVGAMPGDADLDVPRAMREARLAARLRHTNAVAVHDVVEYDGRQWLVMEYVPGRSLSQVLAEERTIPPERAARIGAQIASALASAHALGIVHRDVKPGNVLIDEAWDAKLTDFGIARGTADPQLTREGMVSGTPAYFAPELAIGSDPSPASDVWALGATLFNAVEGEPPYGNDTNVMALLRRIADDHPPVPTHAGALIGPIVAMLQRDPDARSSMVQAVQQLDGVLRATHQTPVGFARLQSDQTRYVTGPRVQPPAPPQQPEPEPARSGRARRRIVVAVAALALFAAGFGTRALVEPAAVADRAVTTSSAGEPSPQTSSTPTPSAAPTTTASVGERGEAFVRTFFQLAVTDRDAAWAMLSPAAQANGRKAFDERWKDVESAEIGQLNVTATLQVSISVSLYPKKGGYTTYLTTMALTAAGDSFLFTAVNGAFVTPDDDDD